jgi:simple sugar transport system ATP-binding protein
MAAGIGMIHQHFTLIDAMTVTENVMLGWDRAGAILKPAVITSQIEEASRTYGLAVNPGDVIAKLSFGQRQRVEIVKAILRGSKLLILDEPTSNLSPPEVAGLLGVIRRLRDQGHSVVFISHKLSEVIEICDEVVVLRDGAVSGHVEIADATRESLARMMVERDLGAPVERKNHSPGAALLTVESVLNDISFAVRSGEILAIAGVDGNGQQNLLDTLAGITPAKTGCIRLGGVDITRMTVRQRLDAGLAYIPVDRARTSLVPRFTIAENMAMRDIDRAPLAFGPFLNTKAIRDMARRRMAAFDIRASGPDVPAGSLSGGNQQKIVLAREIGRQPKVLLAFQPTWGLDPGAARFVLDQLLLLRDAGSAIVYVSAELEEVLTLGDQIAVMSEGRLSRPTPRAAVDVTQIGMLMAGAA